jgi:hypothetical protein
VTWFFAGAVLVDDGVELTELEKYLQGFPLGILHHMDGDQGGVQVSSALCA